jgi:hypothetical protein
MAPEVIPDGLGKTRLQAGHDAYFHSSIMLY